MVIILTSVAFIKLNGATAKTPNVRTLLILPLIECPISINFSTGIPYNCEYLGSR